MEGLIQSVEFVNSKKKEYASKELEYITILDSYNNFEEFLAGNKKQAKAGLDKKNLFSKYHKSNVGIMILSNYRYLLKNTKGETQQFKNRELIANSLADKSYYYNPFPAKVAGDNKSLLKSDFLKYFTINIVPEPARFVVDLTETISNYMSDIEPLQVEKTVIPIEEEEGVEETEETEEVETTPSVEKDYSDEVMQTLNQKLEDNLDNLVGNASISEEQKTSIMESIVYPPELIEGLQYFEKYKIEQGDFQYSETVVIENEAGIITLDLSTFEKLYKEALKPINSVVGLDRTAKNKIMSKIVETFKC